MTRHRRRFGPPTRPRPGGVVLALVLALLVAVTAGCTPGSSADGDEVVLRVAWWGSDSRAAATRAALELYTQAHPEVTIVAEPAPFAGYFDRLATQTAARDAPDLVQMQYAVFAEYVRRGALLPLDDHMPDPLDLSAFDPIIDQQGVLDGQRYAVPTGANTQTIVIDPAVFERAGVPVPDADWTWADFEETARALVASGVVEYGSAELAFADWIFDLWLTQRGASYYTDDGRLGFTADDLTEFWTWTARLRDEGLLPPAAVSNEIADLPDYLVPTGRGAMDIAYSAQITGLTAASGRELQALPFPAGTGEGSRPGQYVIGTGLAWSITSTSDHPEVAADVLAFLVTDPGAIAALGMERGAPLTEAGREIVAEQATGGDATTIAFTEQVLRGPLAADSIFYNRPPLGSADVTGRYRSFAQEVAFGRQTPAAAASAFVSEAEATLAASR